MPENADFRWLLAGALRRKGRLDDAIAEYQETIRLQPGMHYTHRGLGLALDQKERFDDAIVSHREAIRLQPNERAYHYALGALHARKGQWDQAATAFGEAVRLKPVIWLRCTGTPRLFFSGKDLDSHCRTCRSWLDTASGTRPAANLADVTAKVCALRPDVVGEETRVAKLIAIKPNGTEQHDWVHWFDITRGLVEYRAADSSEAVVTAVGR